MPVYEYRALDRAGKNRDGIIDADSPIAARQKLRETGVFPVSVKVSASSAKGSASGKKIRWPFIKRIKLAELSVATRQLAILLGAGITLVASLEAMLMQVSNQGLKRVLAQIKESVNEGNSLARALSNHPRVFSNVYINMVRAGEASGSLELVLHRLADLSEQEQALKGRLKAAMAYPVLMSCVGAVVVFFLVAFVVPNVTRIFNEMHQALPLPTLILIGISDFLMKFWWLVIAVGAGFMVLFWRLKNTKKGRYRWDRLKLAFPLVGPFNIKTAVARFSRTLGSLLQNGVPLLTALDIVKNVVGNTLFGEVVDAAMGAVEKGNALANAITGNPCFPPIAVQMISAGEQSGQLEEMLDKIADMYEREVEAQVMTMTSMLEPVMILFMGVTVGFIVISMLLPIFDLNQMIR
ncbi:MAG: type II secretion system inner membrane protein GspF [Deltaproteobacteria bacterium]|nr:type II secretion system inner membrane protein GspF [Deltaproteobacteria bacterium]